MAYELWGWDELVRAANGVADGTPTGAISGLSIDSRSVAPGDVFVALKDVRDGHDFVTVAFERGAAAALVSDSYVRKPNDGALIRVPDTLKGLESVGCAARSRLAPRGACRRRHRQRWQDHDQGDAARLPIASRRDPRRR